MDQHGFRELRHYLVRHGVKIETVPDGWRLTGSGAIRLIYNPHTAAYHSENGGIVSGQLTVLGAEERAELLAVVVNQ